MLLKLGSNISDISGSISGHTFQHSNGGVQLRSKPSAKKQPSIIQTFIRSIHSRMLFEWQALTPAQRTLWNTYASLNPFTSKFGDKVFLTGQQVFLKYQFFYAFNGLSFLTSPYLYNPNVLGPELIVNGNFNGLDPWQIVAQFQYNLGSLRYTDIATGRFYQSLRLTPGYNFVIHFLIRNSNSGSYFNFTNASGVSLFAPPYNVYSIRKDGFYVYTVNCATGTNFFNIRATAFGASFDISAISIRRLLS